MKYGRVYRPNKRRLNSFGESLKVILLLPLWHDSKVCTACRCCVAARAEGEARRISERAKRLREFQQNKQRDPGTEDLSAAHSAALRSAPTYYARGPLLFQPTTTMAPSQQLPERM